MTGPALPGPARPAARLVPPPRLPVLRAAWSRDGSQARLVLAGEIDVTTEAIVRDAAVRCLLDRPARLLLDLGQVEFCDCAGARALRWVLHRAALASCQASVCGAQPPVRRVFTLLQAGDLLAPAGPAPLPGEYRQQVARHGRRRQERRDRARG